jgi:hypothetical protein
MPIRVPSRVERPWVANQAVLKSKELTSALPCLTLSEHWPVIREQLLSGTYQAEGYRWVVDLDLDLEKFFDRVNHDRLLAKIAERISDKRLLRLIRAFLRAGVCG